MIEAIGGEKVSVWILVPQGSDPHNADLKPRQLKELSKADVYVMIGSGIEFEVKSMAKIRDLNKKMLIIDSSKGIELIEAKSQRHIDGNETEIKGGKDPHIWTSLRNGKIMVQNIYEGLVMADPENKDYYLKNRDIYTHRLDEADTLITKELRIIENRSFMVFHPSWGYFASRYNLEQISIEIQGKEPKPNELIELVKDAKKHEIKIVFVSPQFSQKSAKTIAQNIGGNVVAIDSLSEDWSNDLIKTANEIAKSYK